MICRFGLAVFTSPSADFKKNFKVKWGQKKSLAAKLTSKAKNTFA